MADLTVTIEYKSPARDLALAALNMTFPAWGLVLPFLGLVTFVQCLYFLLYSGWITSGSALASQWLIFAGFLGSVFVAMTCLIVRWQLTRNSLLIDNNGIKVPLLSENYLAGGDFIPWSTISKVQIFPANESDWQKRAIIFFREKKEPLRINLNRLTPEALEQLLLSIDAWGVDLAKESCINELQQQMRAITATNQIEMSYTDMWEEELRRRFLSTAFMPVEPGSMLRDGSLKVMRQLAMGGLSAVYLAQLDGKILVVLKEAVIPDDAVESVKKKAQEMFEREAQFLMKLEHPGVVRVLDYFVDSGRHYLMLEHINGQDTRQLVRQNGAQRENTVIRWAMEIATTLKYLHEQDPPIVHRDLTPDNLVLREDGSIMVIDFGAANEFIGTATGTLVGKQAYIAPEQLRGKAVPQSDLYSLGCTLFYYLTGKEPEALSTSDPRTENAEVSPELAELITTLTEMEEADRYQSAQQLIPVLKMIAATQGVLR
jgi:tRNA A-37 threonylcarbamoyl transferase component Bud32